jgi:lipopolysaccharide/colanic/teichoic acid biosynthesis glycosyltransferase
MTKLSTNDFLIRFFDFSLSLLAILILFPFMLPIMLMLKLTGEHYIFYKQVRIGRYGKEFNVYKFATMLQNSPNLPGGLFTVENDPRILPMGRFLRKTKINELPQLINILKGDMSVVGYRPLVQQGYKLYSDKMKEEIFYYRPGLSGIASIVLHNEEEIMQKISDKDSFYKDVIMAYKERLEGWFMDNYCLRNYFKVIVVTVIIVLSHSSNAWKKAFRNLPEMPKELADFYLDNVK